MDKCKVTTKHSNRRTADLVLFNDNYVPANYPRPHKQIYALYYIETPPHTIRIPDPGII